MKPDNTVIANFNPHYTDKRFNGREVLVWGNREDGDSAVYSDRMAQWNGDKFYDARKEAGKAYSRHSLAWVQELLRKYFDNPKIRLTAVYSITPIKIPSRNAGDRPLKNIK